MKKNKLIVLILIIVIVIFFLFRNSQNKKPAEQWLVENGKPVVSVSEKQNGAGKTCTYTATYGKKIITLDATIQTGDCSVSQGPILANGMLAVIAKDYVFIYDPVKDVTIKLDPYTLSGFSEFAKKYNINLSSEFTTKRFFINGDTLRILYTRNVDEKPRDFPQTLMFATTDWGKTFTFDPKTQQ